MKKNLSELAKYSLGIGFFMLFICMYNAHTVCAESTYIVNHTVDTPCKAGGVTFVARTYQSGNIYPAKIIMKKNGEEIIIADNANAAFITNGKVLYYSKHGTMIDKEFYRFQNTIYRYNIKSGKHTKIITGVDYTVCNCNGKYLYYGTDNGGEGIDLYAINLKTKKKRHMADTVGTIRISGKRVITDTNTGSVDNLPIYSFKPDGSGKKKIADGTLLKAENGKVIYCVWKYSNGQIPDTKCKVYQCTTKGKNKKALSGWLTGIPKKYRDW